MITLAGSVPLFGTLGGKQLTAMTFARTGTAWDDAGVSYAANTPRYGGPIPEPTTNLALWSEDYSNAYWTKTRCAITTNVAIAPDGTLTADKLTEDASAATSHVLNRTALVLPTGVAGVVTVYAKAGERGWLNVSIDNANAIRGIFDLTKGVCTASGSSVVSITDIGGGWFRCSVGTTSVVDGFVKVYLGNNGPGITYSGDGVSGLYIWGIQAETGRSTPTPYTGATGAVPRTRGILATEPSTNIGTWSEPTAMDTTNFPFRDAGLAIQVGGVPGFAGSVHFPGDGVARAAYKRPVFTAGVTYTFSCFVRMDDGGAPVIVNGSNSSGDFGILMEGSVNQSGGITVQPVGNGVYRVIATRPYATGADQFSGLIKYAAMSARGFCATGFQWEASAYATDYIPTTGAVATRAGVPYHNGVIVEESTTNLALQSATLDDTYWTTSAIGATVTANAIVAPDGTVTADKITEDATTAQHYIAKTGILTAGTTYTFSAHLRASERSWAVMQLGDGMATFDLVNAKVGATLTAGFTSKITPLGGGWYRCSITGSTTTVLNVSVRVAVGDTTANFAGVVGNGIYAWGLQLEAKAYPTSYVPTAGATVTRNADSLTVPTVGLLLPAAGTVIASVFVSGDMTGTPVGTHTIVDVGASANVNRVLLYQAAGNAGIRFLVGDSGGASVIAANTTPLTSGRHIFGGRWGPVDTAVWKDGVLAGTQLSKIPASLATPVRIGTSFAGTSQWDDAIAWVAFYDRALTDGEMAAATNGSLPANYTAFYDFSKPTLAGVGHIRNMVYDDQQFGSIGLAPNSIG